MNKQKQLVLSVCAEAEHQPAAYQHHKGTIRDNAIQALLHDRLFRQRIEKKRKGKGSYQRKAKHAGKFIESPIIRFLATKIL